jgi:hypothetical protein
MEFDLYHYDPLEELREQLTAARQLAWEACEVLVQMRDEFRGYDLPYGSEAYHRTNVFLSRPEVCKLAVEAKR